jgi:hypothetical protein
VELGDLFDRSPVLAPAGYDGEMPLPLMDCETPAALAALAGETPAAYVRYLEAPGGMGEGGLSAPPPAGKGVYGDSMDNHLDTENFSVQWAEGDGTDEIAEAAAEALESAWTVLIEEQGWRAPVSSDRYLLWVVLDPSLSGTGFTTEYKTADYPDGYPVVYVNPEMFSYGDFFLALAQHEFHHAIQYGYRNYTASSDEPWYWEASANWAPYLVGPEANSFDYSAAWYADAAELDYASMSGSHQYGMFVLNAYLDTFVAEHTMRTVWELGEGGDRWLDIVATAAGLSADEVWGRFTANYAEDGLDSLGKFGAPRFVRADAGTEAGTDGEAEQFGTVYYEFSGGDGTFLAEFASLDGTAVLSVGEQVGETIELRDGDRFAVTATARSGASWTLAFSEAPEDDTACDPCDTGDTGGEPQDSDQTSLYPDDPEEPGSCGCGGGVPISGVGWFTALVAVCWRRMGQR